MLNNTRIITWAVIGVLFAVVLGLAFWPKPNIKPAPTNAAAVAPAPSFIEETSRGSEPGEVAGKPAMIDKIVVGSAADAGGKYYMSQDAIDEVLQAGNCAPFTRRAQLPAAERGLNLPWFGSTDFWCDAVRDGDGLRIVVLGTRTGANGLPQVSDGLLFFGPKGGSVRVDVHPQLGAAAEQAAAAHAQEQSPASPGSTEWAEYAAIYSSDILTFLKSDSQEIVDTIAELRAMIGR